LSRRGCRAGFEYILAKHADIAAVAQSSIAAKAGKFRPPDKLLAMLSGR
jgi:hypothetical protein